jgi:hypothetical protein
VIPWLSDDEISDLCAGLKQPAAQVRYLRRLGLLVREKPNGRPLVMRADIEALSAPDKKPATGKREPNRAGFLAALKKAA